MSKLMAKTNRVTILLNDREHQKLQEISAEHDVTYSDLIRRGLKIVMREGIL